MSEIKYNDGTSELLNHDEMFAKLVNEAKITTERIWEELTKKDVKSVEVHKPGAIVKKDSKDYLLTEEGDWREIVKMADGSIYFVSEGGKLTMYKERDV